MIQFQTLLLYCKKSNMHVDCRLDSQFGLLKFKVTTLRHLYFEFDSWEFRAGLSLDYLGLRTWIWDYQK